MKRNHPPRDPWDRGIHRKYHSKAVALTQSSGTGKSRVAMEYGNVCAMITHVIREANSGFPPSDEQGLLVIT